MASLEGTTFPMKLLLAALVMTSAILCDVGADPHGELIQRSRNDGDTIDAYDQIQGEWLTSWSGVELFIKGNISYVGSVDNGDYIGFDQVDFQDGAVGVWIQMSSSLEAGKTGTIDFVLDNPDNAPFHSVIVGTTHSDDTWLTINEFLESNDKANQVWNLYLVFRNGFSAQSFVNVDWIEFFQ